jgi:hypothetical protein
VRNLGKIYSIDGYQLTPAQKKVNQRNIYSAFPVREIRSDVLNSQYKTDLKAWLRKYPTPKQQQKYPFQTFEREKSAFEIVKDEVKKFLTEYAVSHYIILLQKLTSIVNYDLMKIHFNLPEGYDFVLDPSHKKKGNVQDMGKGQTLVTIYLNGNAYHLAKKDIIDIFQYINTVAGYDVITTELKAGTGDPHAKFNILDTDLQKQQKIKQIRATNKAKDSTKADITNRVSKYRYIPPALESNYFERNVGDNSELTKIKQLVPTARFKRNEFKETHSHQNT